MAIRFGDEANAANSGGSPKQDSTATSAAQEKAKQKQKSTTALPSLMRSANPGAAAGVAHRTRTPARENAAPHDDRAT